MRMAGTLKDTKAWGHINSYRIRHGFCEWAALLLGTGRSLMDAGTR